MPVPTAVSKFIISICQARAQFSGGERNLKLIEFADLEVRTKLTRSSFY